ncbi:MAG: glycosyltransferase family 25 protein [Bacteroidia bacterium]
MITSNIPGSTYVIHALQGYEAHGEHVRKLFAEHELEFEFVSDGDLSLMTQEQLVKYFVPDVENVMKRGMISCTLNHLLAYERAVERGDPYALVFEDDPFFLGDFVKGLDGLFEEIKRLEPGFIISLENTTLTFPSVWDIKKGQQLYPAKVGRMAGACLIDQEGIRRILADIGHKKVSLAPDWIHNDMISRGAVRMYWAHPPLVEQGSHNGRMVGTISTSSKSFKARIRWLFNKAYKTTIRRLFSQKRIID